jgi:transcriptional regulator with XRE-family HTH domain
MALSPQMADLDLGTRVKIVRGRAGLSQKELADRIGMSRDRISDYENGAAIPSDVLRAICDALDVSSDWLLFGATRAKVNGSPSLSVIEGMRPDRPSPDQRRLRVLGLDVVELPPPGG